MGLEQFRTGKILDKPDFMGLLNNFKKNTLMQHPFRTQSVFKYNYYTCKNVLQYSFANHVSNISDVRLILTAFYGNYIQYILLCPCT